MFRFDKIDKDLQVKTTKHSALFFVACCFARCHKKQQVDPICIDCKLKPWWHVNAHFACWIRRRASTKKCFSRRWHRFQWRLAKALPGFVEKDLSGKGVEVVSKASSHLQWVEVIYWTCIELFNQVAILLCRLQLHVQVCGWRATIRSLVIRLGWCWSTNRNSAKEHRRCLWDQCAP